LGNGKLTSHKILYIFQQSVAFGKPHFLSVLRLQGIEKKATKVKEEL